MKRTKWDKVFSEAVRTRDNWTCQRCSKYIPEGKRQGLHCSHFFGRAKYSTRFDFENCEALCYGCHSHLGSHPSKHERHKKNKLGSKRFYKLMQRSNTRIKKAELLSKENYEYLKKRLAKYKEVAYGKGKND